MMNNFEKICLLAEKKDTEALRKLILSGVDVDERKVGQPWFSPAGFLASQGKFEAAEFLFCEFKASMTALTCGAAIGGHVEYAEKSRKTYQISPNKLATAAAQGRQREYAEKLRKEFDIEASVIAFGAGRGGFKEYAEYLCEHHVSPSNLMA